MFRPKRSLLLATLMLVQITWAMTSSEAEYEVERREEDPMSELFNEVNDREIDDPEELRRHFADHVAKRFSEFIGGKRFSEFIGGKKRFSEFIGGKKRFSEFLGGKKRFSEFLGGKKRFSEFLGGKKRFSEFLGGKKRFSEFLGGKKRFNEFIGGKRDGLSSDEMNRDIDYIGSH